MTRVHVATCAYPIEPLDRFDDFARKQERLASEAARRGAQLLLFPEYASLELASTLPDAQRGSLARELAGLSTLLAPMLSLYSELSARLGVYVLSPSFPVRLEGSAVYRNRAHLHGPGGELGFTEKLQMTRFERESWGISEGESARVFETDLGVVGVAICYDSEFPLLVRRQVAQGAALILVPSCTDTDAGYHRVSLSCRARALENQCYVVQASTVGEAPWSLALDRNVGRGAIYGPVEQSLFPDGVVAEGELNASGWVYGELDLAALAQARSEGQVRNHQDWDRDAHLGHPIERVPLGTWPEA